MPAIRYPVAHCSVCCAPHPVHPTKGCRGCRAREKEKDKERLSHPSTWRECPRCHQLAPLRRPRSFCSICARALVSQRQRRFTPTAADAGLRRMRRAERDAVRTAQRQRERAEARALAEAWQHAHPASPVARQRKALDPLRVALRAAGETARQSRAAAHAADETVRQAKAAAHQAQAQVETDRAALGAAFAALRVARQEYARLCQGLPPLDPTL